MDLQGELMDLQGELMDLLYIGVQHHQDIKRYTFEEFLDENLAGEAYSKAKRAVSLAIVNFILPQRNDRERVLLMKAVDGVLKKEEEEGKKKKK